MAKLYVGLDVHSKDCVYAVQDEDGKLLGEGSVTTSPEGLLLLCRRFDLPEGTPVGLETGTVAFYVARLLARIGLAPRVIEAREVRLLARRANQKSDRRDAFDICDGVRRGRYHSLVHVPPEAITQLRETLGRRRHFVRVRTAEVNATKRLLRAAGLSTVARTCLQTERGWQRLAAALKGDDAMVRWVELHHALWTSTCAQIAALEAMLKQQQAAFAEPFERLRDVPGVGPIVALTAIATFSDVDRFASAKHAASYAGLIPSTYQSGERDAHGGITRRGSVELRTMLCEAAHQARRVDHPLHPYFSSLCARRGYKLAVVAVAHRLCRILWAMLRRRTAFDIEKLGVERGPFEKTTTKLYRLRKNAAVATATA